MNLLSSKSGRAIGESQDCAGQQIETSLLTDLKQRREVMASKLAKLDDAIASLEANPAITEVLQKLSNL